MSGLFVFLRSFPLKNFIAFEDLGISEPVDQAGLANTEWRGRHDKLAKELKDDRAEVIIPLSGRVFLREISLRGERDRGGIPILNIKGVGIQFASS